MLAVVTLAVGWAIQERHLGLPTWYATDVAYPLFFLFLVSGGLLWAGLSDRAGRKLGLACPKCGKALYGGPKHRITTMISVRGRCTVCKTQVLSDPLEP
jgi:MFS family permease